MRRTVGRHRASDHQPGRGEPTEISLLAGLCCSHVFRHRFCRNNWAAPGRLEAEAWSASVLSLLFLLLLVVVPFGPDHVGGFSTDPDGCALVPTT